MPAQSHECECGGTGWLLDQEYGFSDPPATRFPQRKGLKAWTPIQRCDTCNRYDGDETAARAFARAFGTSWCEGELDKSLIDELEEVPPTDFFVGIPPAGPNRDHFYAEALERDRQRVLTTGAFY